MTRFATVGAGRMGRGIAIAFAYAGHKIALIDLKARPEADWQHLRQQAQTEVAQSLTALVQLGALRADQVTRIAERVQYVGARDAAAALAQAELIFEGVPETLQAKADAFAKISAASSSQAILASTTSSMRVTQLAALVTHPQRFLNIHWLNPAYVIPVVELRAREFFNPRDGHDTPRRPGAADGGDGSSRPEFRFSGRVCFEWAPVGAQRRPAQACDAHLRLRTRRSSPSCASDCGPARATAARREPCTGRAR
jgi:3-hydroxyacyl-CoA dehydrogenase, NAD binding domain